MRTNRKVNEVVVETVSYDLEHEFIFNLEEARQIRDALYRTPIHHINWVGKRHPYYDLRDAIERAEKELANVSNS